MGQPVLFRQLRPGYKEKIFSIYKFRTMTNERDAQGELLSDEKRVIGLGKFIRSTSLDELPQLFNVLKGEMSLVGPRAYYPYELEEQQKNYPSSRKYVKVILSGKPGLTGVWQVTGRSEINFDKRIEMDAYYARKKSVIFDLLIMLKTPMVMISGKGAV